MPLVRPRSGDRDDRSAPAPRLRGLTTDGEDGSPLDGIEAAELDQAIAAALELAVLVARMSAQVRPPLPVPKGLRPVVRFAKLPPSARAGVRKVIDEDDDFRGRVAVGADEAGLPRPAWLFLRRPEGWEVELAELVRGAAKADADARDERAERTRQRRLDAAEAAILRLEAALVVARGEATKAADDLNAERRLRRDAEERRDRLERRVGSVEGERDSARRRAESLAASVDALTEELERARSDVARAVTDAEVARAATEHAASRASSMQDEIDRERVRADRLAETIDGALEMTDQLRGCLAGDAPSPVAANDAHGASPAAASIGGPSQPAPPAVAPSPRGRPGPRRTPSPLPFGVFDDSAEAAEHLVRVPKMVVLVDGYNATLSVWRDLPIADQRSRLLDACSELAARTGAELIVVFDGAEPDVALPPPRARRRVRLQFSPPDVEADDVLLDLVEEVDPARPVTVASNDRRVREGAGARGANALSTVQLFAVLRRNPGAR